MKGSFATDLKLGDILALAPTILDLQPQQVQSYYIGRGQVKSWTTPAGAQVLLPIPEKIAALIAGIYADRPTSPQQPIADPVQIEVQNGTGRRDLAAIGADQLQWRGFDAVAAGAAAQPGTQPTRILVRQAPQAVVDALARLLRVKAENILLEPGLDSPAGIRVILGVDYDPCR